MKKPMYVVTILVLLAASFFAGTKSTSSNDTGAGSSQTSSESKTYNLLAKRLFLDEPNDTIINFSELRKEINTYVEVNDIKGSIYFEYLPTGTSIRIGGDDKEVAASLFKVPAAMELYKASEEGLLNLDTTIAIDQSWLDSAFGNLYKKGAGYKLTLREAAKIMLEDSDNTALKAIGAALNSVKLAEEKKPYNFLDVDITQNTDLTVSLSARSYTSFLKCLYFSCFLNKADSQELLGFLSNATYKNRLPAGVDNKSLTIAHKIGNFDQNTQSDCGIIYLPRRNYSLCVMINGPDNAATDKHIASISHLAYSFLANK